MIDAATKTIIATFTDETGHAVHSEKLLEIQSGARKPVADGFQVGQTP